MEVDKKDGVAAGSAKPAYKTKSKTRKFEEVQNEYSKDLKYAKSHEGKDAGEEIHPLVCIDYAQDVLGTPGGCEPAGSSVGMRWEAGETFCGCECEGCFDVFSPVTVTVVWRLTKDP